MSGTLLAMSPEIFRREEMRVRVDTHETCCSACLSVGNENVDERLLAAAHRVARARERRRKLVVSFDALAVAALRRTNSSNGGEGERSARNCPSSSPAAPSLNIESVARRTAP